MFVCMDVLVLNTCINVLKRKPESWKDEKCTSVKCWKKKLLLEIQHQVGFENAFLARNKNKFHFIFLL